MEPSASNGHDHAAESNRQSRQRSQKTRQPQCPAEQSPRDSSPYGDLGCFDRQDSGNLIDLDGDRNRTELQSLSFTVQPTLLDLDDRSSDQDYLYEPPGQINDAAEQHTFPNTCEGIDCDSRLINFCNPCSLVFCDSCWNKQPQHRPGRRIPLGGCHEKTPISIAYKVQNVLDPPEDEAIRERLHLKDEATSWFGMYRPDDGPPLFQDYGRFVDLMASTEEGRSGAWTGLGNGRASGATRDLRTPSLVSFVGETGAGKSTLIKLLIDLNAESHEAYPTPVVGASGVNVPTSEDVHLYADPCTAFSEEPILFADCEGLTGGTREPLGAVFRNKQKNSSASDSASRSPHRGRPVSEREVLWADNASSRTREYATRFLYPRLLYTFSDVIVFVLKNPRVVESVFEQLVEWAVAALEMSSNQPVLPHAVIVLNASSNDLDPLLWEPEVSTAQILESLSRTVNQNRVFKRRAQEWRERGRQIENVEQLMRSYYTSVCIIRIPAKGRPNLIQTQAQKLYSNVLDASAESRMRRSQLRMLLDVEELQSYLDNAFDHFARTLDAPFDFVQASLANSPIPLNFGGNVLKLAITLMNFWKNETDARKIFDEFSHMVASCIMFDLTRNKSKGTAESLFPPYVPHLDAALENFCNSHWPCEYTKPGSETRCVNVRSGHAKGHQDKNGKVIAVGDYCSKFSYDSYHQAFQMKVYLKLRELLNFLQLKTFDGRQEEHKVAAIIHRDAVMTSFFRRCARGKDAHFQSHTACFCCLFEIPEHSLHCGHIICSPCAQIYGFTTEAKELFVNCPLCGDRKNPSPPSKICLKPATAGVRVLTLDGGGMRGIIELEILRLLEQILGGKLAIRNFFDLIVGTSTGGLVALGLGAKKWSVSECITHFEQLCCEAFTPRTGGGVPLIGRLINNYYHSVYETTPLERALVSAFGDEDYLFGGPRTAESLDGCVKVAITSTAAATGTPVVLSNYNRPSMEKASYQFQRPEALSSELKIWEAGRATSAAPRFFKSFHHENSKQVYLDGAIYYNNPIAIADRERRLIWPDLPSDSPDIVLSLGTGASPHARSAKAAPARPARPSRHGVIAHGLNLVKIAKDHIDSSLDCDKAWDDFMAVLPTSWEFSRFVRINPEVSKVPRLDEIGKMKSLQETVRTAWSSGNGGARLRQIARRLIATMFYFKLRKPVGEDGLVKGVLLCRLPAESDEIHELGDLIQTWAFAEQCPFFFVREKDSPGNAQKITFDAPTLERMILSRRFRVPTVELRLSNRLAETEIHLCFNDGEVFPISGFPRSLFKEKVGEHNGAIRRNLDITGSRKNRWVTQLSPRPRWTPPDENTLKSHQSISILEYQSNQSIPELSDTSIRAESQTEQLLRSTPESAPEGTLTSGFVNTLRNLVRGSRPRVPGTTESSSEDRSTNPTSDVEATRNETNFVPELDGRSIVNSVKIIPGMFEVLGDTAQAVELSIDPPSHASTALPDYDDTEELYRLSPSQRLSSNPSTSSSRGQRETSTPATSATSGSELTNVVTPAGFYGQPEAQDDNSKLEAVVSTATISPSHIDSSTLIDYPGRYGEQISMPLRGKLILRIPSKSDDAHADKPPPHDEAPRRFPHPSVPSDVTDVVICTIFNNLYSLDDMEALALVNRGFYGVFKRYEHKIVRTVWRNQKRR